MHTWTAKKLDASYVATTALLLSQNGLRSMQSQSIYFLGGACPQTPLVLLMQHTHTSDIPSKNPGYGPDYVTVA